VLRDAKRMHFLWQPTPVQQEAIDKCIDTCLPQGGGEQFLKGWAVTSVNEWGGDQERLLVGCVSESKAEGRRLEEGAVLPCAASAFTACRRLFRVKGGGGGGCRGRRLLRAVLEEA